MLTKKELEVLTLRVKGKSQKEIAKELNISQAAVSKFEKNAKRKINEAALILEIARKIGIKPENEYDKLIKLVGGEKE